MYPFAIMDWHSREILSWEISNTLVTDFCISALGKALKKWGKSEIFNTDRGCQFTSGEWQKCLKEAEIAISMDGKGRWLDNVFIERFWRSTKYEDIFLKSYENALNLDKGRSEYIERNNTERPHQSLEDWTPEEIYNGKEKIAV